MKNIYLMTIGFTLTLLIFIEPSNSEPVRLGKVTIHNTQSNGFLETLPDFDNVISPFDQCFLSWDGYLSSVKGCVRDAFQKQTDQLVDSGFDEESLAELSDYWRDLCTTLHPDAHELSQLGFLECYYNGRNSWEEE